MGTFKLRTNYPTVSFFNLLEETGLSPHDIVEYIAKGALRPVYIRRVHQEVGDSEYIDHYPPQDYSLEFAGKTFFYRHQVDFFKEYISLAKQIKETDQLEGDTIQVQVSTDAQVEQEIERGETVNPKEVTLLETENKTSTTKTPSELRALHQLDPKTWTRRKLAETFFPGAQDAPFNTKKSWLQRELKKP